MKSLNRQDFPGPQYPTRAIQFGEGNFLRAFIDWQLDLLNEKPIWRRESPSFARSTPSFHRRSILRTDSTPR